MRRALVWTSRVAILIFIAWLVAEGRQWLLRRRAERLLADIKSLELNHTSWSEAQRLMKPWGKWGGWYGRCDSEECAYSIYLDNILFDMPQDVYRGSLHVVARLLDHVGLRTSWVSAGFSVVRGVVTSKSFAVVVALPVRDWGAPNAAYEPWLDIKSSEAATLRYDNPHFLDIRPDRAFLVRRTRLEANFTPEESLKEQTALMNFQLDCINHLSPCRSRAELLPRANQEYEAEKDQVRREATDGKNPFTPTCLPTVVLRAREARDVLVGDVVRASVVPALWESDHAMIWMTDVRLLRVLKGKVPGPVGSVISVYEENIAPVAIDRPWPFHKVIVAGMTTEGWKTNKLVVYSGDCGTVEATPENFAAAQEGVKQDFGHRE